MSLTLPQPARIGLILVALAAAFGVAFALGQSGSTSAATPIKSLQLHSSATEAIPSVTAAASLPTLRNPPAEKTTTSYTAPASTTSTSNTASSSGGSTGSGGGGSSGGGSSGGGSSGGGSSGGGSSGGIIVGNGGN